MIDATHLKAHRTAASLLKKGLFPTYRTHERGLELQTSRGLRRQRSTARDVAQRRPDERLQGRGVDAARHAQSQALAKELLADKGYDADWFREALANRKIAACIPSKSNRKARSPTTPSSTNSATKSRTCSAGSRTGDASTPDTTVAPRLLLRNLHRRSCHLLALIDRVLSLRSGDARPVRPVPLGGGCLSLRRLPSTGCGQSLGSLQVKPPPHRPLRPRPVLQPIWPRPLSGQTPRTTELNLAVAAVSDRSKEGSGGQS